MIDVYCHTSPCGKKYVGVSSRGWEARWQDHVQDSETGSDLLFACAIRKYGADCFDHEVLEQCKTAEEASAAEVRWIAQLDTNGPNGYNGTRGGYGVRTGSYDVADVYSGKPFPVTMGILAGLSMQRDSAPVWNFTGLTRPTAQKIVERFLEDFPSGQ